MEFICNTAIRIAGHSPFTWYFPFISIMKRWREEIKKKKVKREREIAIEKTFVSRKKTLISFSVSSSRGRSYRLLLKIVLCCFGCDLLLCVLQCLLFLLSYCPSRFVSSNLVSQRIKMKSEAICIISFVANCNVMPIVSCSEHWAQEHFAVNDKKSKMSKYFHTCPAIYV